MDVENVKVGSFFQYLRRCFRKKGLNRALKLELMRDVTTLVQRK